MEARACRDHQGRTWVAKDVRPGAGCFFSLGNRSGVGFGEDWQKGNVTVRSIGDEVHVQRLGRDAAIEKYNEAAQCGVVGEVGLNEFGPGISLSLGAAGIAIAGEVHEIKSIGLDAVEVDASGLAWGGTGFGEIFAPGQGIDEAGFAHIGSTHHG